jgi:C-terminal processing protease CtpA/Prc
MRVARNALSIVLALQLAACGGGGSSSTPPATGGGTPAPTPTPSTAACSLRAQQDFGDQVLNEWYLFPSLLANANSASFSNLQSYLDARVEPARLQNRDRGFTYATSIAEENALINSGASAGFGVRLGYDTAARRLFVLEAYEGTAALSAGLDRGSEITAIGTSSSNLQSVTSLFASGGSQAVADALGPSTAGTARVLRFVQPGGATVERSITKTSFSLDPISSRYGALVLNDGSRKIGYLNFRTFIVGTSDRQLAQVFQNFANQGVSDFIIDLRYNGGGLVRIAELMGDLLRDNRTGQVFSRTIFRSSKANLNEAYLFSDTARFYRAATDDFGPPETLPRVAVNRIAFITTGSSASASELVVNSMIPHLGSNMALVGANSFGKPVGQYGFDLAACDLRIRAVTFQTVNASNQGEYYTGLASVVPNTCRAGDDISRPFGDPREASIAAALDFIAGRACTPITAGTGTAPSVAGGMEQGQAERQGLDLPERQPLQPATPIPAQRELPGLF